MADKTPIKSYRDLLVWQRGVDLTEMCFALTEKLPRQQMYGLSSQIQRAASSVPANIAEGFGRRRLGDYIHHLLFANGSLKELETHLIVVVRLKCLSEQQVRPAISLCEETGRMLSGLILKLENRRE